MHRFSAKVFALLFITLLSACGGGSDGGSDGVGTTNLPPPANQAPIADAGADQTVSEAVVVTLQGAGVDADGSIASYSWVETSGTTVSLSDSDTETATFEAPMTVAQLMLIFELTVTDDQGATATDEVVIIVDPVLITQTVVAGQELILTLDSAELVIPADVLDAGVEVSVSIAEIETLAESPVGDGETLITPVYELTFSKRQIVSADMQLSFDIPEEYAAAYFSRITIEGGMAKDGASDIGWSALLANYDQPSGRHIQSLSTTATRILIAAMSRAAPTSNSLASRNETKPTALSVLQQPVANAQLTESLRENNDSTLKTYPAFKDYGWVIYCDPNLFAAQTDPSCDPSHQDFQIMMNDLGAKLYASDKVLTELRHTHSAIKLSTKSDINTSFSGGLNFIIYDPEGRSDILGVDPRSYSYQVAQVDANIFDDRAGVFVPETKTLHVDRFRSDTTVIHELMHAVQLAEIGKAWDVDWIIEGIASAVSDFAPSHSQLGKEFRRTNSDGSPRWRDWSAPLIDPEWKYKTLELWLSMDTSFIKIPNFYFKLSGKGELDIVNSYQLVNESLVEVELPTLRDAYKDLISSRNLDSRYLHCESVTRSCTGESCEIVTPIPSMSASCFEVDVNFESCDDSSQDIVVSLVTAPEAIPNPNLELIVDGVIHPADTEVAFFGVGRIWAINTSYDDAGAGPPESATIKFENKTEANCYIKLVSQNIGSGARAVAGSDPNALGPGSEFTSQEYRSFEDLITDSTIFTLVSGVGENTIIVEPLNLDAWETVHNVNASYQHPDGGDISIASASSSASTDTDIVDNAMITTGQQTVMASTSGSRYELQAAAGSSNRYVYAIGSVPVELTLDWGCSMSLVQVKLFAPEGGFPETLLVTRNTLDLSINNWECDTRNWTIPAGHILHIGISSGHDEYQDDIAETYKDSGGGFEINFQPIFPDEE